MNKSELLNALEKVRPGLANKETIEQSTSFAFKNGKVITYNDEISISHPVKGLEIEGAVEAEKLYNLLSKLSKEEIDLWIENSEVKIKSGKTKAGITLQEEIKMPAPEVPDICYSLPDDFIQAVQFALFSCSKDFSKPVFTCVHINSDERVVESSDNYRLTRYTMNKDWPCDSIMIPHTSAKELTKCDVTQVALSEGWAHFATEAGTIFSLRVFNGKFPDISKFFDVDGTIVKMPKRISEMLDRAGIFSKRKFFLDEYIEIELKENKMKISANSNNGWITDTANVAYKDDPIKFSTNPRFLADMCKETRQAVIGEASMKFSTDDWEHVIALTKS